MGAVEGERERESEKEKESEGEKDVGRDRERLLSPFPSHWPNLEALTTIKTALETWVVPCNSGIRERS
jgi:hypothetical protein